MEGFVCLSVSIDACAVTSSPASLPPAPPPFLRSLFAHPRLTLSANQSSLRCQRPRGCQDWLGPGKGLEFYLAFQLSREIQLEPV